MYEHRFLENINKLYKTAGKFEDQQKYKAIIEAALVSKTEGCTKKIPMAPNPYESTQNPGSIKPLLQFTETLDVKHNTDVRGFFAAKAKRKAIKKLNVLWSNIVKCRGHTKINQNII